MSGRQYDVKPRFGDYAMTLEEVGQALGVSRERIRQIETKALNKCRMILARRGFYPARFPGW